MTTRLTSKLHPNSVNRIGNYKVMPSRTSLLNTSRLFVLLLALVACLSDLRAQTTTPQDRGFQPGGSYAAGDIETINLQGGNLMINLPLAGLPAGRGGIGSKLYLTYNSKIWDELVNNPQHLQCPSGAVCAPPPAATNTLVESPEGGWNYAFQYQLQLDTRDYPLPTSYNSSQYNPCTDLNAVYYYRLMVRFPDGGQHEFKLQGQQDSNGYYKYKPDGSPSSWCSSTQPLTGTLNYYTTDGTYMRLEVQHDSDTNWANNPWTLYMPDGGRVTGGNAAQRIYDRNDNYVEVQSLSADPAYNNHVTVKLVDQVGRKVVLEYGSGVGQDSIHAWGVNNVEMVTTIKWKDLYVYKSYRPGAVSYFKPTGLSPMRVVDYITLPAQSGGLQYTFGYNPGASNPSYGWGELNSVTLPTGATTAYQYSMDGQDQVYTSSVIDSRPTRKDLTYQQEYDGATTSATETWLYSKTGTAVTVTGPDGGVTTETFSGAQSKKTETPDGTVTERDWQRNSPFGASYYQFSGGPMKDNYYVRSEYTSIRNSVGTLVKTAIKDYAYDKNGNVTSVKEYDWVEWSSVHDGSGNPVWNATRPAVVRQTDTGYFNDTPAASDSSSDDPDVYHKSTAPRKQDSAKWSEVKDPALPNLGVLTRTEFTYDDPATRGNITVKKSWDSTKGTYSDPLTASNSISASTQYDGYGNPTLITDTNGHQTKLTYGSVGGVSDLYPTMTEKAYGTPVERTAAAQYDFSTGLVTLSTDVDNNVSTSTSYDVFGRPTLVKAAVGTSDESRVQTIYDDAARRVVVRSDLSAAGDGKLVSVNHYDQLGRVRLTRRLEDASAQSETDETAGIKVQTRYKYSGANGYTLVSNPYRSATSAAASGEGTMGWTVRTSDRGRRKVRSESFGGAALPAPWGTNSSSTGLILTSYDADATTVTEPTTASQTTLREKRSVTDGLGRLAKVYEDTSGSNQLTSYTYNALGNLTGVSQGSQTRSFVYSSLSRLVSATNPEECQQQQAQCVPAPVTYEYDPTGNVKKKTDARGVVINYLYDALDRITSTSYSNESTHTPDVTYSYDNPSGTYAKGRLWKTETAGIAATVFDTYDALGRTKKYHQSFSSNGIYGPNYDVQYTYNRAGSVTSQTYPSGNSVNYSYDAAGRLGDSGTQPAFSGNLGDGVLRTYASQVLYAPQGGVSQERFGTDTPVYNKHLFNNRGQLAEIRVSTYPITAAGQLATDWNRGAIINHYSTAAGAWGATGGGADNNGNLRKQDIYISNTDDVNAGYSQSTIFYDYDALNRLYQARETWGGSNLWVQYFDYDRWGNRTINATNTTGSAPEPQFSIDASTNRLGVPAGQTGAMSYDAAGNLTNDTYKGGGTRTYDAENRMTSAQFISGQLQTAAYTYDGDGHRLKRKLGAGAEVWQVYGVSGELLAEYAADASPSSPQKEYGYRGGELLVTAEPGTSGAQGGATVANPFVTSMSLTSSLRGDAAGWAGLKFTTGAQPVTVSSLGRLCSPGNSLSHDLKIVRASDNVTVATATASMSGCTVGQLKYAQLASPVTLPANTAYVLVSYEPGGDTFRDWTGTWLTTSSVATIDGAIYTINGGQTWSLATGSGNSYVPVGFEYQTPAPQPLVTGMTLGAMRADSPGWAGNKITVGSQSLTVTDIGRLCNSGNSLSHDLKIVRASDGATVATVTASMSGCTAGQFKYAQLSSPVTLLANTAYYVLSYEVGSDTFRDWVGTWLTTTSAATVNAGVYTINGGQTWSLATGSGNSYVPLDIKYLPFGTNADVKWLVADQLGTPRMVVDKTGSLSGVSRHDYLPFGEEIPGDQNWRTSPRGYGGVTVRQRWAELERDDETGLDYARARYYANVQGRFTSVDSYDINIERQSTPGKEEAEATFNKYLLSPQQWNRYAYAVNNPLRYTDPSGEKAQLTGDENQRRLQFAELKKVVGPTASEYLYVREEVTTNADGSTTTNYYADYRSNDPNRTTPGPSFDIINDVAADIAKIIDSPQTVGLSIVPSGTQLTDDRGNKVTIGPIDGTGTPAATGAFGGKLMLYFLDPSVNPGKIPAALMQDGKPGTMYPGEVLGHDLGHVLGIMSGRGNNTKADSLQLENKVRLLYNKKAVPRKSH